MLWLLFVSVYVFHCSKEFDSIVETEKMIEESEMKKLCKKNDLKTFTFTSPQSTKKLTFQQIKYRDDDPKSLIGPLWKLIQVDGENAILTEIKFMLYYSGPKTLYLSQLYSGYPNVSGIDIMTCLMTICAVCDLNFVTLDASDLTTPYMHLYKQNYYEATIMGKNALIESHNIPIEKGEFLTCVHNFLEIKEEKADLHHLCNQKVRLCETEKNLKPEHCPINKPWISYLLHTDIFPRCFDAPNMSTIRVEYSISAKNLNAIWNKSFPPVNNILAPVENLTPATYEEMGAHCHPEKLIQIMQKAIHFCVRDIIDFTPFNILKIVFPCVKHETEMFFKYSNTSEF